MKQNQNILPGKGCEAHTGGNEKAMEIAVLVSSGIVLTVLGGLVWVVLGRHVWPALRSSDRAALLAVQLEAARVEEECRSDAVGARQYLCD
jgi:hypothetical protein